VLYERVKHTNIAHGSYHKPTLDMACFVERRRSTEWSSGRKDVAGLSRVIEVRTTGA